MAVTSITLADPVSGYSVPLTPQPGVAVASLDVEPAVRAVTEDRVGGHGGYDSTRFLSAAAVTLNMLLYDDPAGVGQAAFLGLLEPLLNPAARPALIVTDTDWAGAWQLTVRLDSMSKARSDPTNWPVQITWTAPAGVWEQVVPVTLGIPVTVPSTTGMTIKATSGLHFTPTTGLHFPPTSAPGETSVTNPGTAVSQWAGQLYGPATGPKLANDSTGLSLNFTDSLTLGPGDYIALDTSARSANLNGDPRSSVLGSIDFGTSNWWLLVPGVNQIRYYPTTAQPAGASAVIVYRPARMT